MKEEIYILRQSQDEDKSIGYPLKELRDNIKIECTLENIFGKLGFIIISNKKNYLGGYPGFVLKLTKEQEKEILKRLEISLHTLNL